MSWWLQPILVLVATLVTIFVFAYRVAVAAKRRHEQFRCDEVWADPRKIANWIWVIGAAVSSLLVALAVADRGAGFAFALGCVPFVLLVVPVFAHAYEEIPGGSSIQVGVVTVLGTMVPVLVTQGPEFFLFRGFLFGRELVSRKIRDYEQTVSNVIFPNHDVGDLKLQLNWGASPDNPAAIINLLKHGEEEMKSLIDNNALEEARQWATSDDRGPQSGDEAVRSTQYSSIYLLREIAGGEDVIPDVAGFEDAPVQDLIDYLLGYSPNQAQRRRWASNPEDSKDWGRLKGRIDPDRARVEREVGILVQLAQRLRSGSEKPMVWQYGIIIPKLFITEVVAKGKWAEYQDAISRERGQAPARIMEADTFDEIAITRAKRLDIPKVRAAELQTVLEGDKNASIDIRELRISLDENAKDAAANLQGLRDISINTGGAKGSTGGKKGGGK